MVATEEIVREYHDGPDAAAENHAVEEAFRQGFLEEARRIVRHWAHPPGPLPPPTGPITLRELLAKRRCDPSAEAEDVWQQRQRLRDRCSVYEPGDAGPETRHIGYQPGHEVEAARLRGRHHAMVYVTGMWEDLETADLDIFDPKLLCPWLRAVEMWAEAPIRPNKIVPPPRPIEVVPEADIEPQVIILDAPTPRANPTSSSASLVPTGNLVTSASSLSPASSSSPPPASRYTLTRADQLEMRPPQWLLRGMLERDTFALIFGDPGCGKSFLAIDWACRIATGTPWRGHPVKAGPVIYVAGEGQLGFGRRIRAWSEHHGVSLDGVPLYLAPSVAIPEPTDLLGLVSAIDTAIAAVGRPVMIVLDTLARCFGGGDENSTQDMSRFVAACDAIRYRYECTILVVHHAGHGDKSRARGAIALKAALDAEYRLENDNGLLLTSTKMKDAETPPPLALRLVAVDLPDLVDDDDNPVTSAAIEVLDPETSTIIAEVKANGPGGKWQKLGLQIAKRLATGGAAAEVTMEAWRDACAAAGMVRQNQHRVLQALVERGEITMNNGNLIIKKR